MASQSSNLITVRAQRFDTDREVATELDKQLGLWRCFYNVSTEWQDIVKHCRYIASIVECLDGDYPGIGGAQ